MEPPKDDEPAGVARLLKEGWQRSTLAFFNDMPKDEIAELLPAIVDGWTDEDYMMLKREAKRQKRRLDLDDNLFLQHQALLFRDRSFIDRKLEDTPLGQARMGAEIEVVRGTLPRVGWRSGMHRRLTRRWLTRSFALPSLGKLKREETGTAKEHNPKKMRKLKHIYIL